MDPLVTNALFKRLSFHATQQRVWQKVPNIKHIRAQLIESISSEKGTNPYELYLWWKSLMTGLSYEEGG